MTTNDIAERLLRAYVTREAIEPISSGPGVRTVDEAYAIQLAQVDRWRRDGRVVRGHKIGLTSAAMREQLGIDQPDYGHLFEDMFFTPGEPVPVGRFLQPRAEPEIAFVLSGDLAGPGLTVDDAAAAVGSVHAALEIIDSRIADWRIGLVDTIADNASSGGAVVAAEPLPVAATDLADVECVFRVDGEVVATGVGSDVSGTPLGALAWLANRLGELGHRLEAGHVVLSGSLTKAAGISAGNVVTADFPSLGSVRATFA
ncbi:2-keto-4-pentenoate hydratase [Phytohabitans kaempferiae]|uniref:2-keto-4-pentenoate hydratase n=1 Tax=Phytohabitans kaempferiae TaxID=1620943 RepID=A0ABV6M276_9ACTN